MDNQYTEIAKTLLMLATMLYSKKKLEELEDAKAKLNFIITNGGSEKALTPVIPHIITYATAKKKEILSRDIAAFDYMPKLQNNVYQNIFIKIPQLAGEYLKLFNNEEQDIFWKKLNILIVKSAKIYAN